MKEEVLQYIDKNQLLKKNSIVLVGTSGGPDSLALLHFFYSIRKEWNLKVVCVSLEHGMRGKESVADFHFVKSICEKWEIPFAGASINVPAYRYKKNMSEEMAARELRYEFYEQQMDKFQGDYLALGHHGDDQVETMLMSLARTASSSAFAGIPISRSFAGGKIIRPFLCVTKEHILSYCRQHRLEPRIDSTNEETNHTRNYFRKYIVPLIKERNENIHQTGGHLSKTLQEDEIFLQKEAKKVLQEVAELDVDRKMCVLKINQFQKLPLALQRRAFHLILKYLYGENLNNLSYIHDEEFFSLIRHNKGHASLDFPYRLKLEKSYDRLLFYFPHQHQTANKLTYSKRLNLPGKTELPDGSLIVANFVDSLQHDGIHTFTFHAEQVKLPLHIRTRKPGDRMTWKGLNGSKKLKDLFIDYKIPSDERNRWPIVVDAQGKIIWLVSLKKNYLNTSPQEGIFIQLNYKKGDN